MNVAACAGAFACSVGLAASIAGASSMMSANTATTDAATPAVAAAAVADTPAAAAPADTAAAAPALCDGAASTDCAMPAAAPALGSTSVYVLPAPSGDPARDYAALQAAINDSRYDTIDGATGGGGRQSYTIKGMIEINRSLTIRNLELHQTNTGYVVRTLYAAGGGVPITLRLDNIKIERGPAGSEATGSVSDSAGIWTTNVIPQFTNVEVYGGGKGNGLEIVNAPGGYLTDVSVHDITWTPYAADQADSSFWSKYTLATLRAANNWNQFQILDYDGQGSLVRKRIEEQANGIVLDNVTGLRVLRPKISRIQTRFADGMVYPYESDGITVVSGNQISIQDAQIDHVAEGIDVPAFPARAIDISGAIISDVPVFCVKTRGSYDSRSFGISDSTEYVTIRNTQAWRCGMAAYMTAGGGDAWFENTLAVDTGMGPDGSASPGIGGVAAYRFMSSSTLPTLDGASRPIGMHIVNATVSNPNSGYMQAAFHSENSPADKRTYSAVKAYQLNNPAQPKVTVSTNFTSVDPTPASTVASN